jgi:hypothetical protein
VAANLSIPSDRLCTPCFFPLSLCQLIRWAILWRCDSARVPRQQVQCCCLHELCFCVACVRGLSLALLTHHVIAAAFIILTLTALIPVHCQSRCAGNEKYSMRKTMIPSFIEPALAETVCR